MDDQPPPLPVIRREALLRGPLILTAFSRVLSIAFYFTCVSGSVLEFKEIVYRPRPPSAVYLTNWALLAASMWFFLLFSVLLAWLFFTRRRMFRPLAVYYTLLLPVLLGCLGMYLGRPPVPGRAVKNEGMALTVCGYGLASVIYAIPFWPFYYFFSPRVKRVFTR